MDLMKAVCHEMPLAAGTGPIRQPTRQSTRRLGLEKEKEVSHQVQDLLNRDLIKLAHSAWSSPCPGSEKGWALEVLLGLSQTKQRDHSGRLLSSEDQ